MKKFLFAEMPLDERRATLEANADSIEHGFIYNKNLDEDEIAVFKDLFADTCIDLSRLKEELDKIKTEYKSKMKPIDEKIASLLEIIKTRQMSENGTVYLLKDEEEKVMGYYDSRGELIHSRRLTPEEQSPARLSVSHRNGTQG